MCVPEERRSVPGTKAENFVLLVDLKAPGRPRSTEELQEPVMTPGCWRRKRKSARKTREEMEVGDGAPPPISPAVI